MLFAQGVSFLKERLTSNLLRPPYFASKTSATRLCTDPIPWYTWRYFCAFVCVRVHHFRFWIGWAHVCYPNTSIHTTKDI